MVKVWVCLFLDNRPMKAYQGYYILCTVSCVEFTSIFLKALRHTLFTEYPNKIACICAWHSHPQYNFVLYNTVQRIECTQNEKESKRVEKMHLENIFFEYDRRFMHKYCERRRETLIRAEKSNSNESFRIENLINKIFL